MSLLESGDDIYRMAHITMRDRNNKSIPAIRCFAPSPVDDYKLSVDQAKNSTPEISLSRVGATVKRDGSFKSLKDFEVYILNVGEIKKITGILDVVTDPVNNYPEKVGIPNNPSHCLIHVSKSAEEDEPEIYSKMRDSAIKAEVNYNVSLDLSQQIKANWGL